jgi:hypothetical protein
MKNIAAPLLALAATSLSLGAAAQAATGLAGGNGLGRILHMNPDPSVAWMLAIGFLGVIVLRRTRPGPMN